MSRSRSYVFTVNNYTDEDEHQCWAMPWEVKDCKYICVGKEIGESGTPHLQGYIYFCQPKSLNQLKGFFPTAHFETRRGSHSQAADYCKKDGDFFEWGTLPMDDAAKGSAGAAAMESLMETTMECIREGNFKGIPYAATHFIKACEYRLFKEQQQDINLEMIDGDMEHEWVYGEPGAGKSHKSRAENEGAYIKDPKKEWWDNYKGEEVVIIEDFDKYQVAQGGDMKRWLDRYSFKAQIKGGYLDIRPRKVIVTSNYHPNEIWDDAMTQAAITRRVKITKMENTIYNPWSKKYKDMMKARNDRNESMDIDIES